MMYLATRKGIQSTRNTTDRTAIIRVLRSKTRDFLAPDFIVWNPNTVVAFEMLGTLLRDNCGKEVRRCSTDVVLMDSFLMVKSAVQARSNETLADVAACASPRVLPKEEEACWDAGGSNGKSFASQLGLGSNVESSGRSRSFLS